MANKIKILNLYAGIGGNRKLWEDVEVTAIENNPKIAAIYQDFFPNDKVLVVDAHQYLLEHFSEFDLIWSSRPCITHTRVNIANALNPYKDNTKQIKNGGAIPIRYVDMGLYQEIILLKHFFRGKWCVENVIGYYEPLIKPTASISRHYFWSNFFIGDYVHIHQKQHQTKLNKLEEIKMFNLKGRNCGQRKDQVLRNCVNPYLGLHILNESKRDIHPELF